MKYLLGTLLIAIMLFGCIGGSETQPLSFQDTFTMGGKKYTVTVHTEPAEPLGAKSFTLRIELQDAETKGAVKHLTYDLEIKDSSGRTVYWDSRHAMEGAPYSQEITLKPGDYAVKIGVDHGMGDKIMRLYEKEKRFIVR